MKTAISLPDDVFQEAERTAAHLGLSRSKLYARALREFLDRQAEDPVTAALDEVADELGAEIGPAVGRRLIDSGSWEW